MFIDVEESRAEHPFPESEAATEAARIERANRLARLSVSARNLMLAHGYLAGFMLRVYGDHARVARLDNACVCAVTSPLVSLRTRHGLRSVQGFFRRFSHPWEEGGPESVGGGDNTICKLTREDIEWLRSRLGDEANDLLACPPLHERRRVLVWDKGRPDHLHVYLLFRPHAVNAGVF